MPDVRMYQKLFLLLIPLLIIPTGFYGCPKSVTEKSPTNTGKKPVSEKASDNQPIPEKISPERIAELEKRFIDSPTSYLSASDLVNAYVKTNHVDKALGVLDKYINNAEGPDIERAKIDRAVLLLNSGGAQEAYKELLALAENKDGKLRGEAYFQLGNMIATNKYVPPQVNKVEIAKKYFKNALDNGEVDPLLYRRLADLTYGEKDLDSAREYLAIYLAVYPYDGDSWLDLGNWSVEAKDYKRAREYFKRALESKKDDVQKKAQSALDKLPES
jgi:tetratricopeptide (TPR) repeat protein